MNVSQNQSKLSTKMRMRMGRSYQCFLLYKALLYRNNTDIHKLDVVERNMSVFGRYLDFFVSVSDSLLTKAIIDLYIFFDKDSANYSYLDLLKELKPKCNHRTYEDLDKKIEKLFDEVKLERNLLVNYRHGSLAHEGKNKNDSILVLEQIESLFLTTQEVFNLINDPLEDSYTDFTLYTQNDALNEADAIFRDLDSGFKEYLRVTKAEEESDLNYKNKTNG